METELEEIDRTLQYAVIIRVINFGVMRVELDTVKSICIFSRHGRLRRDCITQEALMYA